MGQDRFRVLVTGGAGYIGSLLCPILLEQGHDVALFDDFRYGVRPILGFASNPRLQVINGDVRDEQLVRKAIAKADVIIHLAAIVGYPACAADPREAESTNLTGTHHLCKAASPRQMFLFASTGSTYGQVDGVADERTPINPLTLYGRTKSDGEQMVRDIGGVSLRFATVFGVSPRLRLDLLVNDFCYQACHNKLIVVFEGHHRRTFLHVRDAVMAYPFAMNRFEKMRGEVYNVGGSSMNYTKLDVVRAIRKHVDFYLHEADVGSDADQRNYEVRYAKIEELGYQTRVTLDEGIQEVLKVVPHIHLASEWRNL